MRVGFSNGAGSALFSIALHEEIFDRRGIRVIPVKFDSAASALDSLAAGEIELAVSFGVGEPLLRIARGEDFRIVGGSVGGGHPLFSLPERASEFARPSGFLGKSVAILNTTGSKVLVGTTGELAFFGAAAAAGAKAGKETTVVSVPNADALFAKLRSGEVDAAIGAPGHIARAATEKVVVAAFSDDWTLEHPNCRVLATTAALRTKRDHLVKFLSALILAERVLATDHEAAVRAISQVQSLDATAAEAQLSNPHFKFESNPNLKGVEALRWAQAALGIAPGHFDARRAVETGPWREALAALASDGAAPEEFLRAVAARSDRQDG